MFIERYRRAITEGALAPDAAQEAAAKKLQSLSDALRRDRRWVWWRRGPRPRGLYLWGDVGRGKSMLMDMFFADAPVKSKRRVHFNAFMADIHARVHAQRSAGGDDPIPPVARAIATEARLLCFDEFQVTDVADAMILGRLFERLFESGVVVVATSNIPPDRLYEGGLNRQLFLPFIAGIARNLDVIELGGHEDHRRTPISGLKTYFTPLGPAADAGMDELWQQLTGTKTGAAMNLAVLGRTLLVPEAANGAARFSFGALCGAALGAADYLAIARRFHTVFIDRMAFLAPEQRNEARRLTLLIDTLYDEGVGLVCSAAGPPDALYPEGHDADAFRRTASRLVEMRGEDYWNRQEHRRR